MRENALNMPVEEAHEIAVEMADKAVRRTHGSTAITQPTGVHAKHESICYEPDFALWILQSRL